jgi:phosphoserine phosphatase
MIKLKDILNEGKSLYVFDFDDTLARSDAFIYVKKRNGQELTLDPAEYAVSKE